MLNPIWAGACLEGLRVSKPYRAVSLWFTGERTSVNRQEGRGYELTIDRVWAMNPETNLDFETAQNDEFVIIIAWEDLIKRRWHKRKYTGVTCNNIEIQSNGQMQFSENQTFVATSEHRSGGATIIPGIYGTPIQLDAGDYLVDDNGNYVIEDA